MSTVRDIYDIACPVCGSDEHIVIAIRIWVDLSADGTSETGWSEHHWHNGSVCRCTRCNTCATVAQFTVSDGGAP